MAGVVLSAYRIALVISALSILYGLLKKIVVYGAVGIKLCRKGTNLGMPYAVPTTRQTRYENNALLSARYVQSF